MTAHEHDRDLVMALAEGSLDGEAERRARDAVVGCAECAEELAWQTEALAALHGAASATMTEPESSRLHRELDAALAHERFAPVATAPPRRRFNWAPVFSVAAVLLALVLVAPTLDLLGGGGDDAAEEVAAGFEGATEQADTGTARLQNVGDGDDAAEEAAPTEEFSAAPVTTVAAPEAAADAAGDGDEGVVTTTVIAAEEVTPYESELTEIDDLVTGTSTPVDARAGLAEEWTLSFAPAEEDDDTCVATGAARIDQLFGARPESSYLLGEIVLAPGAEPLTVTVHMIDDDSIVLAHDPATCTVMASSP